MFPTYEHVKKMAEGAAIMANVITRPYKLHP